MTLNDAMDLPFVDGDLGATTIRKYLKELLYCLVEEGEGFSGKRPFGNSGWEYFAQKPLIESGLLQGSLDEEGYAECDQAEYNALLLQCVEAL